MGLLEKAQNMRESESASLEGAVQGLRARAESMRAEPALANQENNQNAAGAGIEIRGLLKRAEAMRAANPGGVANQTDRYESSIPSAPQGLLRRAEALRQSADLAEDTSVTVLTPEPEAEAENVRTVTPAGDGSVVSALDGSDGELFVPDLPETTAEIGQDVFSEVETDPAEALAPGVEDAARRLIPETAV